MNQRLEADETLASVLTLSGMLFVLFTLLAIFGLLAPSKPERVAKPRPAVQAKPDQPQPQEAPPKPKQVAPAGRYDSVNDYFKAGNPNPISHRLGKHNYIRSVSESTKKKVKKRDGNCCLVCGSTRQLEVDHRIALMNGGDNSEENLGTLCDSCHVIKTRLDYKVRTHRRKQGGR